VAVGAKITPQCKFLRIGNRNTRPIYNRQGDSLYSDITRFNTGFPNRARHSLLHRIRGSNRPPLNFVSKVSAVEEGITVESTAAMGPDDVITCQYRKTGVFLQCGFTLKHFISQLFSNRNDPDMGRNMSVHYSGKDKVGAVSCAYADRHPTNQCVPANPICTIT
jgi:hypothetical protein